jgi:hypothetical protein
MTTTESQDQFSPPSPRSVLPPARCAAAGKTAWPSFAASLSPSGPCNETAYGCFMAGPSATADIEATLVHGAQGGRSLNVLFLPRA